MRGVRLIGVGGMIAMALGGGAARAQPAQEDGWFAARIREQPAAERADFKPAEAGYVRLAIDIRNAQFAALCPRDGADQRALQRNASGLFRSFLRKDSAWGVAGQIWYAPVGAAPLAETAPPTLEHDIVSVQKFAGRPSCKPLSDNSDVVTPLLRADIGMAPIRVGIKSWLVDKADEQRIDQIQTIATLASTFAGFTATLAQPLIANARTSFTRAINADTASGHRDTFDLSRPDAGKVLLLHFGRTPPVDLASWKPGDADPYAEVRLVSIGSAFQPTSPTYPDLSRLTSSDVLDRARLGGSSVRELLRGDEYDKLQRATSVAELDAACVDLRRTVGGRTGLSPPDEALAIYHLAYEHQTLGARALSGDAIGGAPFLTSTCVRGLARDLERLNVKLPEPPRPAFRPVEPTSRQMTDALNAFAAVLQAEDADAAASVARLAFGGRLELQDADQALGGEEARTLEGADAIGRALWAGFGRAGCWLPYPRQEGSPWPAAGFTRDKPWTRMAAAIATPETGAGALLVRFEFDAETSQEAGKITRIDVRRRIGQTLEAFRTTYPNGCVGGTWRPSEVFGEAAPAQ